MSPHLVFHTNSCLGQQWGGPQYLFNISVIILVPDHHPTPSTPPPHHHHLHHYYETSWFLVPHFFICKVIHIHAFITGSHIIKPEHWCNVNLVITIGGFWQFPASFKNNWIRRSGKSDVDSRTDRHQLAPPPIVVLAPQVQCTGTPWPGSGHLSSLCTDSFQVEQIELLTPTH